LIKSLIPLQFKVLNPLVHSSLEITNCFFVLNFQNKMRTTISEASTDISLQNFNKPSNVILSLSSSSSATSPLVTHVTPSSPRLSSAALPQHGPIPVHAQPAHDAAPASISTSASSPRLTAQPSTRLSSATEQQKIIESETKKLQNVNLFFSQVITPTINKLISDMKDQGVETSLKDVKSTFLNMELAHPGVLTALINTSHHYLAQYTSRYGAGGSMSSHDGDSGNGSRPTSRSHSQSGANGAGYDSYRQFGSSADLPPSRRGVSKFDLDNEGDEPGAS